MQTRQRYTASQVIDALHQVHGLVYLAAKLLRCDPETIHNYCKRYPAVQAAKVDARGELVDVAEAKLWQAVHHGEAWAITLVLKTLGRERGYVERREEQVQGTVMHEHIHTWKERLQAAHNALEERRNGLTALPEGPGKALVDEPTD
jgi:hypothetical protein